MAIHGCSRYAAQSIFHRQCNREQRGLSAQKKRGAKVKKRQIGAGNNAAKRRAGVLLPAALWMFTLLRRIHVVKDDPTGHRASVRPCQITCRLNIAPIRNIFQPLRYCNMLLVPNATI